MEKRRVINNVWKDTKCTYGLDEIGVIWDGLHEKIMQSLRETWLDKAD